MSRKLPVSTLLTLLFAGFTAGCADLSYKPTSIDRPETEPDFVQVNYDQRTWYPPGMIPFDPIGFGKNVEVPINSVRTKIVGPTYRDALNSLAAKIWMIENAEYTVDLVYYIFKRDPVGFAILGALCNAVKRGVDIRLMVDSIGSIHVHHNELRALETCSHEAGFIKDERGMPTAKKARVQVVIVNAVSKIFVRMNRRAHDKIIVVDGHVPDKAIVMTGGRNISVSYYGINDDGTPDPTAYQDLEMVLRPNRERSANQKTIGDVTSYYYTLLFLHSGNRRFKPVYDDGEYAAGNEGFYQKIYRLEREQAQQSLAFIKNIPEVKTSLAAMPVYLGENYYRTRVRLAHELGNLTNAAAITGVADNLQHNPNSIQTIARRIEVEGEPIKHMRIVSPYFFIARYIDSEGNEIFDGVKEIYKFLEINPESTFELITNSVLTSDNFSAQAIIDMDTAPRMLLSPELLEKWLSGLEEGELNAQLVDSDEWKAMVNNPRIKIYEMGKNDSVLLGGDTHYGKLHAKYVTADGLGFVGTSNFDYRSRLFNNEFGFFFQGEELYEQLNEIFEDLKARSYRWGSPEWLEMRRQVMSQKGIKGSTTRKQRGISRFLRATGIVWYL